MDHWAEAHKALTKAQLLHSARREEASQWTTIAVEHLYLALRPPSEAKRAPRRLPPEV